MENQAIESCLIIERMPDIELLIGMNILCAHITYIPSFARLIDANESDNNNSLQLKMVRLSEIGAKICVIRTRFHILQRNI